MDAEAKLDSEMNIFFILKSLQKIRSSLDCLTSYHSMHIINDINHCYLNHTLMKDKKEIAHTFK